MTKAVIQNRKSGEAIVHITLAAAGSETIAVGGGNASDLDTDAGIAGDETVTAANISKIKFGVGNLTTGFWRITRNSVTVAVLSGTGELNFDSSGMELDQNNTFDIVCNLVGASAEGFLLLELQKVSSVANDQYLRG